MDVMSDKEVGERWRKLCEDCGPGESCTNHGSELRLIRKLVEERASHVLDRDNPTQEGCIAIALRDFNIDPKDFSPATDPGGQGE